MENPLLSMTNEELWQLFPIVLTEHQAVWIKRYAEEAGRLTEAVGKENIIRIDHIGSTSVPGLLAKPTIDILLQIRDTAKPEAFIERMQNAGYLFSPQPQKPPPHMMFLKGYTVNGFEGQVYHVHVRYQGDWDELYFCEYLRRHPEKAREYGELKLRLQKEYEHDRDGYTAAKSDFILSVTKLARARTAAPEMPCTFSN